MGRDTVSLGLAVKYQHGAGSSSGLAGNASRDKAPPGAWLCPQRRQSPLCACPQISELSALPWPVGAAVPASCSQNWEGEGDGTALGSLDTTEDTKAPQVLLFCRNHSPGRALREFPHSFL